jgi:hypothetical protein
VCSSTSGGIVIALLWFTTCLENCRVSASLTPDFGTMSNPTPITTVFQRSVDAFKTKSGLSQDELQDFEMTSIDDLKVQISIIQSDQRKAKKLLYLKRLGPFLDTMEQYGKIVEVFLNIHEVVAFIWVGLSLVSLRSSHQLNKYRGL